MYRYVTRMLLLWVIFASNAIAAASTVRVTDLYEVGQGNVALTTTSLKGRTQRFTPTVLIASQYVYSPYGVQKNLNKPKVLPHHVLNVSQNQFGYTGQTSDPSTNLMMLGHFRNYAPGIGRFIQPDTYNSFSKHHINNAMAYVVGNSVKLTDPSGHNPLVGFIKIVGLDPKTDARGVLDFIDFLPHGSGFLEDAANILLLISAPATDVDISLKQDAERLLSGGKFAGIYPSENELLATGLCREDFLKVKAPPRKIPEMLKNMYHARVREIIHPILDTISDPADKALILNEVKRLKALSSTGRSVESLQELDAGINRLNRTLNGRQ